MSNPGRSHVIRLAEVQGGIPGRAGEHSVSLLQRGTLDVELSLAPACFTTASETHSRQATFYSWLPEPSIVSRTLPATSQCGLFSSAHRVARFQRRAWNKAPGLCSYRVNTTSSPTEIRPGATT